VRSLHRPAGTAARDGDPVVLTPEDVGWRFAGLRVVALGAGERRSLTLDGVEAAAVPLAGAFRVEVDGRVFELQGREDVFARVPDLAYLPLGAEIVVTSVAGGEVAIATARAERRFDAAYLPADGVRVEVRGGGVATRQVNDLLAADTFEADRLIVVEVLTPDGNWSSFPPHKHDEHTDRERPLEEIYYFRIRGEDGFGIHRTYTADRSIDATVTVRDGDVFVIPRGYHGPCIAAPGHTMYYLNVMAGPAERAWMVCFDPAHERLANVLGAAGTDPRCPLTSAAGPRTGIGRS
jgi:5-deoxy-glucuronate isomerase